MYRIIFLLLITSASFGQVLQETNGSRAENRIVHKIGFRLPQVCWVTGNPNLLNYSAFMSKGAMVYDTCAGKIKRWDGSVWVSIQDSTAGGGGGGITTVGTFQLGSTANGASISGSNIYMHKVSATNPGMLSTGTDTIAGDKTFTGIINQGTAYPAAKQYYYNGGAGSRYGVGINLTELQQFFPAIARFTWNVGGDLQTSGTNELMRLTGAGLLGIGTTTPAAKLSVNASSGGLNSGLKITNTGAGTGDYAVAEFVNDVADISQVYLSGSNYTPVATIRARGGGWLNSGIGGLSFVANNSHANSVITFATGTSAVERMRVNANGAVITSTATDALLITGANAARSSFQVSNSVNTGNASFYLQNNRGSFAAYGGQLMGGSADATGNLFGVSRADRFFVFADGANNLGMAVGTLSNQPLILGTNNSERIRVEGDGDVGIGTTAPSASSILDLTSTSKGFLRPRMTTAQRNAIASPAAGLSVYNSSLATNDVYTTAWYQQPNGLTGSGTLDFPSTGAHSSSDLTITVTGAAVNDIVELGTPVQDIDGTFTAFVSAANTVTVRFNHYGSGTSNPASGTFKVYVIKN
jgi:hypothetical protein